MDLNLPYMVNTFFLALKGIPTTLLITLVALAAGLPIGFFMALSKIYNVRVLRRIVSVYVSFIRGTPVVLQILIVYSLLPSLLNIIIKRLGLGINIFDVNPILYAFIVFTINATAELSELCRSALLTVDRGQLEAALSTGLTRAQAYRRIIIPQALVAALPNLCNVTIHLIKSTSLAFLMTVKDITAIAKVEAAYGYNYIESYIDIFIIYILVCSVTQFLFSLAEKRFGTYKSLKQA
jgi:L-cystine transport system permease protein